MRVLLLGVGMQGRAALQDLVTSPQVSEVIAADLSSAALEDYVEARRWGDKVRVEEVQAGDPDSLERLMRMKPVVAIDLLPPDYITAVASAAIEHGVHLVNTFYVPPALKELAGTAQSRQVTILPEFGLDPGLDLVMLGQAAGMLDSIEELRSYGAGIPELEAASNTLRYKISWTFEGVLRSYQSPARLVRQGQPVVLDRKQVLATENVHALEVADLGTLEAFPNGDVLPYLRLLGLDPGSLHAAGRYTLRWPGHSAVWKTLIDLHLLDPEPVEFAGVSVDRLEFLARALEPHLQYADGERDLAIVRVEAAGRRSGRPERVVLSLVDRRDLSTGLSAMSRTVGFTASIGAILIGTGEIAKHGLLSPLKDVPFSVLEKELRARGLRIEVQRA